MTFGAHKLVHSEPFWTTCRKFDNCCQRYVMSCGKKLYRCTSTFSALKFCSGFFSSQILQLYIRSGAHHLFRRCLDFSQFLTTISRKLWRHLAKKWELCSASERKIHSEKKVWKLLQNRQTNRHTILVWTMPLPPRTGRPSVTYKNTNFRSYSRRT